MPRSRASFVLLIMAMLAAGVVATLWLTTQAIAGSYKLERLHEHNAELAERAAKLERVVTKRESAPWLAEQARQLGMVPGGTPAKVVVRPDGSVTVVGEPKKVTAPAPPPPPESAAEPEADPADEGTAGNGQQPQGDDSAPAPPEQESSGQDSAEQDTQAAGAGG